MCEMKVKRVHEHKRCRSVFKMVRGTKTRVFSFNQSDKCLKVQSKLEKRLNKRLQLRQVDSVDNCDVIMAFVPIVSRAGTDIEAALQNIPTDRPVILMVLHHTFDENYIPPQSKRCVNRDGVFAADFLFYENVGLLECLTNNKALKSVTDYLISMDPKTPLVPVNQQPPRKRCICLGVSVVVAVGIALLIYFLIHKSHGQGNTQTTILHRSHHNPPGLSLDFRMLPVRSVYPLVLGKTMNSDKHFMDHLRSKMKLREVDSQNDCDAVIAFVPIVSRAGTDIQAALEKIPKHSHKRIVLVSLHHTFDRDYIAPDSRHSVKRNDVFAVDCLYHEDTGLLNTRTNDEALKRVIKHLGGEAPYKVSERSLSIGANKTELIPWLCAVLSSFLFFLVLPEEYSFFNIFIFEMFLLIVIYVSMRYYSLNKWTLWIFIGKKQPVACTLSSNEFTPERVTRLRSPFKMTQATIRVFVKVLGRTMKSDKTFMDHLKISTKLRKVNSVNDSDVIIAFVPIVSRAGTDIAAAMEKIPLNKPVVLVVLHHTYDQNYIAPDSRLCVNSDKVFAVDCLYHEDEGLLKCLRNDDAIRAVKKHLRGDDHIENDSILNCWLCVLKEPANLTRILIGVFVCLLIILLIIVIIKFTLLTR
ncbi:hypothetical protein AMELA_G00030750 [Ameiurus melas]|uniref:Uncharacterized protein n=1 Tax=Ameiurus melas TaxID=219545 RepID=A0A7J6BA48_AMEME|nr:hypothetical protein AMELA_G00030750 [Ameiurus melas]